MGILDGLGHVLIKADKYTKITTVSNDVIMCSYMDKQKEAADHYKLYDNGTLAKYDRIR